MKSDETLETNSLKLLPTIDEYRLQNTDNLQISANLEHIERIIVNKTNLSEYKSKLILDLFFKSIIEILLFENSKLNVLKLGQFRLSSYIDKHKSRRTNIIFRCFRKVKNKYKNG